MCTHTSEYIEINGHKVKKPLTSLQYVNQAYAVTFMHDELCVLLTYYSPDRNNFYLEKGLCHATKEDAIAHAKALLSFTTP